MRNNNRIQTQDKTYIHTHTKTHKSQKPLLTPLATYGAKCGAD